MDLSEGFNYVSVLDKCNIHQAVANGDLFDIVYADSDSEQKRKNGTLGQMEGNASVGMSESYVDGEGVTRRRLLAGISYTYSFSGTGYDRVLSVTIDGTTTENKQALQTVCDTNYGGGTVEIL